MLVNNRMQPIRFKGLFSPNPSSSNNASEEELLGESRHLMPTDSSPYGASDVRDSFVSAGTTGPAKDNAKAQAAALKKQNKASANMLTHLKTVKKTTEKEQRAVLRELFLMALQHNYLTIEQQYVQNGKREVRRTRPVCKIEYPPSQIADMDLENNLRLFKWGFIGDCQSIQQEMLDHYEFGDKVKYQPGNTPRPIHTLSDPERQQLEEISQEQRELEAAMEQLKQNKLKTIEEELTRIEAASRMLAGKL